MSDKKTLLLVDGSSYLYRAFFAGGDNMSTTLPDGTVQKTGAIRIMINMMNSLRKEVRCDFAVCVFDAKGPTFRDEWYPQYKANRSPMPDDLRSQIEPIHQVVGLLGWKVMAVPGVEADDVIGTLAVIAAKQGIEVVVSSGDKDLSQLVNEHITIIDTMNGKKRDVAGVTAEFGVPPHLMIDYQTLVGDTVDNVPGVPKVGPKTAAKWLQEYGSLDALVARAGEIKGAVGENLRGALDWLPQGRRLVTIRTDCDMTGHVAGLPAMDAIAIGAEDVVGLKGFYEKYGFKGLAKSVGSAASAVSTARPESVEGASGGVQSERGAGNSAPGLFDEPGAPAAAATPRGSTVAYDTVLTWEAFDTWLAKVSTADLVALDTETT